VNFIEKQDFVKLFRVDTITWRKHNETRINQNVGSLFRTSTILEIIS